MINVKLRDYQLKGIEDILEAWKAHRSVMFQMPTGTGKTTLFCEIVRRFTTQIVPGKKVLIITHRKELVEQVFNRLVDDFRLSSGIISANYIGNESSPVQIASIQTLVRRPKHHEDIFSVVIIDEAHHALASTYKKLWRYYSGSKFLGVTATPVRTNGEGFDDLFDVLVTTPSVKWFVQNDYLSDTRYYASHIPDLKDVKIKAGDYDETELSEVMSDQKVMSELVQSYRDFAAGKKMIVFAVSRSHAYKIVDRYNNEGIPAKSIDTYTPSEDRRRIVSEFRTNEFKVLCNVNIFTEGFDCPDVDAVQLARPTKSLSLFLQQVGRCMRPFGNKQYGIILDNAGLWKEHGLPKMDRPWSLKTMNRYPCSVERIVGMKEMRTNGRSEPEETKAIRLVEIEEIDGQVDTTTIKYSEIEKNLIDKKVITMRERMEYLMKQVAKLEMRKAEEQDEDVKEIIGEKVSVLKKELQNLQQEFQPQRLQQVLELMIEKCLELIDSNDIFIDGDKDVFLKNFVEPSFDGIPFKKQDKTQRTADKVSELISSPINGGEGLEVFHHFHRANKTVTAAFFPSSGKIEYKGQLFSPSAAAMKATGDVQGNHPSLNGWRFWCFIDKEGNTKTIESAKMR